MRCVFGCSAIAAVALAASAIPSSAATVSLVGFGGAGLTAIQSFPFEIDGGVLSSKALSYTSDFVEFTVTPTTPTTTVVDVLANKAGTASFPKEFWRIVSGTTTGAVVVGPTGVTTGSNTPITATLIGGIDYFLELTSGTPLAGKGLGNSQFSVSVAATPIPGALVLFGSILAGAAGLVKRGRRQSALAV
jgi:hypothetical protein